MSYEIHQGFKRNVVVSYTKADGSAGIVEGLPVWSLLPEAIGTLVVAADGMSADVIWTGTGVATLSITADGDLGTGVFPVVISDTFDFVAPLGAVAAQFSVSGEVPVV